MAEPEDPDGSVHREHRFHGWMAWLYALSHRNPASNRAVVELARLEPGDRVLDIGCGPGAAVRGAAARLPAGHAAGVDPSPQMIRIATRRSRRLANVSFTVAGAEQLPFGGESFDVAWTVQAMHHWLDRSAGLAEVLRVLVPGARFLVVEQLDGGKPWGISPAEVEEVAAALRAAGFGGVDTIQHRIGRATHVVIEGRRPS